jgi:hypothetical protein
MESKRMENARRVAVSPRHEVHLSEEYASLLDRPPRNDFVVRTVGHKEAQGLPLMSAEIVIAGEATRERHPLARTYPLHFRKTYHPGSFHADPKVELERTQRVCEDVHVPAPIGCEPRVFRSCLVPGTPYSRLTPFGFEPEMWNLGRATGLPLPNAIGLWHLMEDAFAQVNALHRCGVAHGDLELHNMVACPSPVELVLIDLGSAVVKDELAPEEWQKRCDADLHHVLREALLLQVGLGRQPSPLGELSRARAQDLLRDGDRFLTAIDLRITP